MQSQTPDGTSVSSSLSAAFMHMRVGRITPNRNPFGHRLDADASMGSTVRSGDDWSGSL